MQIIYLSPHASPLVDNTKKKKKKVKIVYTSIQ